MATAQALRAARAARSRSGGRAAPKMSGQSGVMELLVMGGLTVGLLAGGGAVAAMYGGAGFGQVKVIQGSFAPEKALDYGTGGVPAPIAPVTQRNAPAVVQATPAAPTGGG